MTDPKSMTNHELVLAYGDAEAVYQANLINGNAIPGGRIERDQLEAELLRRLKDIPSRLLRVDA